MSVGLNPDRIEESGPRLHKPGVEGSSPSAASFDSVQIDHEPAEVHHARPGVSASQLKLLARSPVQYYQQVICGEKPAFESAALAYGTLLHTWAELGDKRFFDTAKQYPESVLTATGQVGKAAKEWAAGQPDGTLLVTPSDFRKLYEQTRQLLLNKAWVELVEQTTDREFNVRWRWGEHACRGRIDGATDSCWYDLKTTKEEDPWKSAWRAVEFYHYDIQAAFYGDCSQRLGIDKPLRFVFTSTTSYLNCVVWLPPEVMERGRMRCIRLLEEQKQRRDWNQWLPHYYGEAHELKCPAFMGRDGDGE